MRSSVQIVSLLAAFAMLPGCFEELLEEPSLGPSCVDESDTEEWLCGNEVIPECDDGLGGMAPIELWPPNHDFWTITPEDCGISDACDTDLDVVFLRATSDEPVNLAYGTRTDLNTVLTMIDDHLETPLEIEARPPRVGDVPHSQADDRRVRALFPDIEPVPLDIGLKATIDWMRTVVS